MSEHMLVIPPHQVSVQLAIVIASAVFVVTVRVSHAAAFVVVICVCLFFLNLEQSTRDKCILNQQKLYLG